MADVLALLLERVGVRVRVRVRDDVDLLLELEGDADHLALGVQRGAAAG